MVGPGALVVVALGLRCIDCLCCGPDWEWAPLVAWLGSIFHDGSLERPHSTSIAGRAPLRIHHKCDTYSAGSYPGRHKECRKRLDTLVASQKLRRRACLDPQPGENLEPKLHNGLGFRVKCILKMMIAIKVFVMMDEKKQPRNHVFPIQPQRIYLLLDE